MASHIPLLDIQEDSLQLVLCPIGKEPCYFHKALPQNLLHQGRITDSAGLAEEIRQFFKENKLSLRRVNLIQPRQQRSEDLVDILRKAKLTPVCTIPRDAAYRALLPVGTSACLVIPEGDRFQAVFFHAGNQKMGRMADSAQALNQMLQIYRFSNPDAPISRVYLPRKLDWPLGSDWEIHPLEDLLPKSVPSEAAAAFGGSQVRETDGIRFQADFSAKQFALRIGLGLAILLFLYAGILKPLNQRKLAREELARQQTLAAQLESRLADYDTLYAAYLRTGGGILTESELALADRTAILDLVDQTICPRANVTELTLSGNSLTLHLTDISLQDAGALVSKLNDHPLINQAQLHSVEADSAKTSSIYLRITLADANKEVEK